MEDTITVNAGNVKYSAEDATLSIDELVALLEEAKSEGATHIVFLSGNHRGPQYVSLQRGYDWLEDGDE